MTTTQISNLKYDSSSLSFSWTCKASCKNKTSLFEFDKYGNKCYFILDLKSYNNGYNSYSNVHNTTHHMQASLEFSEINPLKHNQHVLCIVHFGTTNEKYNVCLMKSDSKTFIYSDMYLQHTQLGRYTQSPTSVNIELHFGNKHNDFLLQNMNLLLSSGNYSDLKLTVGNKVFNVHKSILGTRNNVLAKMIESNETETINLSKWNVIAVEELLKYIYTRDCDVSKNPQELFKVSHFLDIEELQEMCTDYLKSNIDGENLITVLKLAVQSEYKLSELKEAAKNFIDKNESAIAENLDFIDYLSNSICLGNIEFALKLSKKYKIKNLIEAAMKFVYYNYEEVLEDTECEKFLTSNPTLLFKILKYQKNDIAIINKIETLQQ